MTEYLAFIIAVLAAGASWYCYRWGRDDGYAAGHADGELGIQRPPPAPQAGGGPGVPE